MKFLGAIAALAVSSILEGLALALLWSWFVVPLGAPAIGAAHALGLSMLLTATRSPRYYKDHEDEEFLFRLIASLLRLGMIVGAAAVVRGLM